MNAPSRHQLEISPEGEISFIYDDALRDLMKLGAAETVRASHVEPTLEGGWTADLGPSGGPILGPFETRQEALDQERQWLENHGFGSRVQVKD